MKAKGILFCIVAILLALCMGAGIALAFYRVSDSGWEQTFTASTVLFKLNGKTAESFTSYDLGMISRGDSVDLDMEISVRSKTNLTAASSYRADFTVTGELARAVKVYRLEEGEYVYRGMLDKMESIAGVMPLNSAKTYYYRLVYSEAASDYFDGTDFSVRVGASNEILTETEGLLFVSSLATLKEASEVFAAGKTVVLTGDVTVPSGSDITLSGVDLDLNGYTLTLESDVEITVPDGMERVKLCNSAQTGGIKGSGRLIVGCGVGKYALVSNLDGSLNRIDVQGADFHSIAGLMQARLDELASSTLLAGDRLNFASGLEYCFTAGYDVTPPMNGGVPDESVVTGSSCDWFVSPSYAEEVTSVKTVTLYLTDGLGKARTLTASLKIRGSALRSVADAVLESVPDVLNGSLFLPAYDEVSKCTLTWVTEEEYLTSDGRFLPFGIDGLSSWQTAETRVGVIAHFEGSVCRAEKKAAVSVMNAEERTLRIYDYGRPVLDEVGFVYSPYASGVDAVLAQKAGLKDVRLSIDGEQSYLDVTDAGFGQGIRVLALPSSDRSASFEFTATFVYADGGSEIAYSVKRTVTVVGHSSSVELADPTSRLMQDFEQNAYIRGEGYRFNVRAYTAQGANVDFFVSPPYSDYVAVLNDVYTAAADGHFVKLNGEYVYFATAYSKNDAGEYEADADGGYILTDGVYTDITEERAAGEIYERQAQITVLPAKVPSAAVTAAPIAAKVWEEIIDGERVYLKDTDGSELTYGMTLSVRGIYHHAADEIADYNLYTALLEYYDLDGDGWIEVSEAGTEWTDGGGNLLLAAEPDSASAGGRTYRYIDMSGRGISSVKGLEYFTAAKGYDLGNNSIITLESLERLYGLEYLDLGSNLVTDIASLRYLDTLGYLNLASNRVYSLEEIRYLPSVRHLDLRYNEEIASIEPLSGYTNLSYLNILQRAELYNRSGDTVYYLALLTDANRGNGFTVIRSLSDGAGADGAAPYAAADETVVAAKALSEMTVIDEVGVALNVPGSYYYEYSVAGTVYRKRYKVMWETAGSDRDYLEFKNVGNSTTGYTIKSPVVDRTMNIYVRVTEEGSDTAAELNRKFVLTLLPGEDEASLARIEIQPGIFRLASDAVPDNALRALLFNALNSEQDGYVPERGSDGTLTGGSTAYLNANTLSYSEMTRANVNVNSFRDAGIESLEGIQYFDKAVAFDLDLTGNRLSDPSEIALLSELSLVKGITLGGQEYDFTLLSSYSSDGTATGLTGLERLDVSGCYNLSSDGALTALYGVYLANGAVDIYLRSSDEVWNPYEKLSLYAQSLPSAFVFININDVADYYAGGGSFSVRFYDLLTVEFRLATDAYGNVDGRLIGVKSNNFTHTATGVRYHALSGYSDTVYDAVTIAGNDGSGRGDIVCDHYIELKIEFNHNILVTDYAEDYTALDVIFPGRDLRQAVLSRLTSLFGGFPASGMDTIGSGFYKEGDCYYITLATLAGLPFSGTLEVDGTYSDTGGGVIQGLNLTSVTSLKISRDANLGDGTALSGLTTLIVTFSGVDFSSIKTDLPNLRNIYLGVSGSSATETSYSSNRYAILYDGSGVTPYYSMKHFVNLREFVAISSNIYEWEGLNGLVGIDLQKLHIYETGDGWSNKNARFASTVAIAGQIYENSAASDKEFRLGSKQSATDKNALFNPSDWGADIGQTGITQQEAREYSELASYIIDLGVKLNGTLHLLDAEQTLESGESLTLPYSAGESFFGTDYMTGADYSARAFAVKWQAIGLNAEMAARLFGIVPGAEGRTHTGLPTVELPPFDATVTPYPYDVYFILRGEIGAAYLDKNGAEHPLGGTLRAFTYPVLIKGTTAGSATSNVYVKNGEVTKAETVAVPNSPFFSIGGENYMSYGAFSDIGFRFVMFTALAAVGYNDLPGLLHYSSDNLSANYLPTVNSLVVNNVTATANFPKPVPDGGNTNYRYDLFGGNAPGISQYVSIEGISALAGLSSLNLSTNLCSDIEDLAELAQWENENIVMADGLKTSSAGLKSITIGTNMLTCLNPLRDFTGLTSLNFSNNYINTLAAEDGSFVLSNSLPTLTSLNLSNNNGLSMEDLYLLTAAAKDLSAGGKALAMTNLNLSAYGINNALYTMSAEQAVSLGLGAEERTVSALDFYGMLCASRNGGAIQINGVGGITSAVVDGFFADMAELDNAKSYLSSGFSLDSAESMLTSYTAAGGTIYTLKLLNAPNLTDHLESVRGNLGYSTAYLLISDNGNAVLKAVYRINITDAEAAVGARLKVGDSYYTSADFGDGLWQYIVKNAVKLGNQVIEYNPVSFILTSESGIDSLKGINLFPNLTEIKIASNRITELWSGSFPSLTTLVFDGISLSADILSSVRFAPNLRSLVTARVSGVNFNQPVTIDVNGVKETVTLAEIILRNNKNLNELLINNEFGMNIYSGSGAKSALRAAMEYLNGNNYLFGIDSLVYNGTECARKIGSLSKFGVTETKTMTNQPKNIFFFNNTYHTEGAAAYIAALQSDVPSNLMETVVYPSSSVRYDAYNTFDVNTNFNQTMGFALNLNTVIGREIIPSTITDNGINGEGVKFYLPSAVAYGSSVYTVDWTCDNPDYLTEGEGGAMLFIDKNNFASESEITLTATVRGRGCGFPRTYSKKITIAKADIEYTAPRVRLSPYYVELPGSDGELHLFDAGSYFKSSRLTYWLFNSLNVSAISYERAMSENMSTSAIGKYYLPWNVLLSTTSLNIPNEGITTLEGLQLFGNLRSFTLQMGSVISLSPLSNMRLDSFNYVNTNGNTNYIIQDFSPLFNSRETLTSFSYATNGGVQIDDLSFLMSFGALKTVTVGVRGTAITGYENTPGFRYMAAWFAINRPDVKITYNGALLPAPSPEWKKAAGILANYRVDNDSAELVENFRLAVKNYSGGTAELYLPRLMDEGGLVYGIGYKSVSSFMTAGASVYRGESLVFGIAGGSLALSDGDIVGETTFGELLQNTGFIRGYLNGQCSVEQRFILNDGDKNTLNMAYITARITVDGYDFERMLTINCDENAVYPRITLPDGFGSLILPSYAEWYLNKDGARIDFVNNAASSDGVSLYRFSVKGAAYSLLILENPDSIRGGEYRLEGVSGGTGTLYSLSHGFTEEDIDKAMSGGRTAGQKEYYRAMELAGAISGFAGVKEIILRRLDALYAEYNEQYIAGRYSAETFAAITAVYEQAGRDIAATGDFAEASALYHEAGIGMAGFDVLGKLSYGDGKGGVLASVYAGEGSAIVLADYSESFVSDGILTGWIIDGVNYRTGDIFVMTGSDVAAIPFFLHDLKYYLADDGVAAESNAYAAALGKYYSAFYEFTERGGEHILENIQFVTDTAANRAVSFANVLRSYNIVAVNVKNGKIFRVEAKLDMTGRTRGRYDIGFAAGAAEARICDALFTFMGDSMNGWQKPDETLPFTYDKSTGLYFIELAVKNNGNGKFMALKNGVTAASPVYNESDLAQSQYYPLSWYGASSASDSNFRFSKGFTYTLYFSPRAYVYDGLGFDYGSDGPASSFGYGETGFVSDGTEGSLEQVGAGAALFFGNYEKTSATAAGMYKTEIYNKNAAPAPARNAYGHQSGNSRRAIGEQAAPAYRRDDLYYAEEENG